MLINNNTIYILVHDQDIIIDKEKNNCYKKFLSYKYLFMGFGNIDKIKILIKNEKVIICRNLKYSLDEFDNKLLAFVGWYSLVMNNLIKTKFTTLFEYDVIPIDNLNFNKNYSINGFIKDKIRPYDTFFYKNNFIEKLFERNNFNKDFSDLNSVVYNNSNYWCSTSNFTIDKKTLIKFVNWYYDIIKKHRLLEENGITQIHERIISIFAFINKIKIIHNEGIIKHQMLNSHNFNY